MLPMKHHETMIVPIAGRFCWGTFGKAIGFVGGFLGKPFKQSGQNELKDSNFIYPLDEVGI